jgi:DNA-binding transcriptional MerR regulator
MSKLMTLSEVAKELRTPEATLRYWRHIGKGPTSFKIGRRVMYYATDLEAWLLKQRAGAGDAA